MQIISTFSTLLLVTSAIVPTVFAETEVQQLTRKLVEYDGLLEKLGRQKQQQSELIRQTNAKLAPLITQLKEQTERKLDLDKQFTTTEQMKLLTFEHLTAAKSKAQKEAKNAAKRKNWAAQLNELNDRPLPSDNMKDSDLVNFE